MSARGGGEEKMVIPERNPLKREIAEKGGERIIGAKGEIRDICCRGPGNSIFRRISGILVVSQVTSHKREEL